MGRNVCKISHLVFHHRVQRTVGAGVIEADHFVNEHCSFGARGVSDALFDNVRSELVLGQLQHLAPDSRNDTRFVFWFAVFYR